MFGQFCRSFKAQAPRPYWQQRRHAQVHDIRLLATHSKPGEKIVDRYRDKLDRKAKEEGHESIDSLKEAYASKITDLRKKATVDVARPAARDNESSMEPHGSIPYHPPPPPRPEPESTTTGSSQEAKAGVKTLNSFIDVEKFYDLSDQQIEYLWRLRHANNPHSLCGFVQANVFQNIVTAAKRNPRFVLPIPREGQGAELHFLQWTFPTDTTATVIFTNLAEFKLRGEFAQPHTSITHHTDMLDRKGVVLVEGNVLPNRGVTVEEGQLLVLMLNKFYGQDDSSPRRQLLGQFNKGDDAFSVERLLEEAEKVP